MGFAPATQNGGSVSAVGDVVLSSDTGGSGTGDIIFQVDGGLQKLRLTNKGQLLWRNADKSAITAKPNGDGSQGLFDLIHDDTAGYLFHLTTGPNSSAPAAAFAIGTDQGSSHGLLISHKNSGDGIALAHNPSASGPGVYVQGYSNQNFPLRVDSYAGASPTIFTSQTGAAYKDGVSNGTTTFTSATAAFTAGDVGATLSQLTSTPSTPSVIPAGTTITGFTNATTVTLSNPIPAATSIQFLVSGRAPSASQVILQLQAATSFEIVLSTGKAGDTKAKFYVQESGGLNWGSGTATVDVNLYRGTNGRLQSDYQILASDGLMTKVVAGSVSDASFSRAPGDGMIALDSTNSKIWVRIGGAWKSVAVA